MINQFDLARQKAEAQKIHQSRQGRGLAYSPMQQFQQPRPQREGGEDRLLEAAKAHLGTSEPEGEGGWKGFIGGVLNTPVASVLAKPLEAISMGGRGVTVGVEELAKALPEWAEFLNPLGMLVDEDKSRDDDRSWTDKIKDNSYGYGQITYNTGNKWVDRAVGLAGDLLLDPTTYLTGGSGKFAGTAGRLAAAEKLAIKGADAATIQKVSRLGISSLDDVTREMIGAGPAGARFMGKRIAGTGGATNAVARGVSKGAARVGDTSVGRGAAALRTPKNIKDEVASLRAKDPTLDPRSAITVIHARNVIRSEGRTFGQSHAADLRKVMAMSPSERSALTHAAEKGVDNEASRLAASVFSGAKEKGVSGLTERANYVTHVPTSSGKSLMQSLRETGQIKVDDLQSHGRAFARSLEPGGTYSYNGQAVTLGDASVDDINRKFGPLVGGEKVMEDDFAKIAQVMVGTTAEDVGVAQAVRSAKTNFPDQVEAETLGLEGQGWKQIVDENATKATNKTAKAASKKEVDKIKTVVKGLEAEIGSASKQSLRDAKAYLTSVIDELGTASKASKAELKRILAADVAEGKNLDNFLDAWRTQYEASQDWVKNSSRYLEMENDDAYAALGGVVRPGGRKSDARQLEALAELAEKDFEVFEAITTGRREVLQSEVGVAEGNSAALRAQRSEREAVSGAMQDEFREGAVAARSELAVFEATKAEAKALRGEVRDLPQNSRVRLQESMDELDQILSEWGGKTPDPETQQILDQLVDVRRMEVEVEGLGWTKKRHEDFIQYVKDGSLPERMKAVAADGWSRLESRVFAAGDSVMMRDQVRNGFLNATEMTGKKEYWRLYDNYTSFFKTYATATPGFHVRNFMSASFMNATEGVTIREHAEAMAWWKKVWSDPKLIADEGSAPQYIKDAFKATYGSGAGGRFGADEIADPTLYGRATNNKVTRGSQRMGEWVEGPMRLALALNTTKRGGDTAEALARVTRIHFDYSQLSEFDEAMKRVIPFWTFMSRSLPLQLQQQFLKPRAYARFDHAVRNFTDEDAEGTMPEWMEAAGGFMVGDGKAIVPDFPHLDIQEQLAMLGDPKRLVANANPLPRAATEIFMDHQLYKDRPFYEDENKPQYFATNTLPVLAQLERLSGGRVSQAFTGDRDERRDDRQFEAMLNWLGIPTKSVDVPKTQEDIAQALRDSLA